MIGLLGVALLLGLYGTAGAGRAGWRRWRDQRDEQRAHLAHEARRAGRPAGVIRAEVVDDKEARRAHEWRTGYDAYIADFNAAYRAVWAGWPLHDDAPFDPSYWPAVEAPEEGPAAATVDLAALVEFEPHAALAVVERANAAPTVFSWQTGELPLVERPVCQPAKLRPRRRRDTLRRALDVSTPFLPL